MNNFRTEIKLKPSRPITHQSVILTSGSCFADHLGAQLSFHKFPCLINPFGVSYNPVAIHEVLDAALHSTPIEEDLIVALGEHWHHLLYHSRWAALSADDLIEQLINVQGEVNSHLQKTDILMLTYGTAWVYRHKKSGKIVGNCHKLPASGFEKFLLSPAQIIESFGALFRNLQSIRPNIRIILTVSPVRHTRDTLELNNVSKSALRLACHYLSTQHQEVEYFPSYEIMMDDLRDYRFYESDMIHPNETARLYLWEQFSRVYFSSETLELVQRIGNLKRRLAHRPFHADSRSHQQFLRENIRLLEELMPSLDVREELQQVNVQLIH